MSPRSLLVPVLVGLAGAGPAQSQTLGAGECVRCHSHARQADQWQTREPATLGDRAHAKSLERLGSPAAVAIAKRAGLAEPRHPRCLKCHATLVRGRPRSGVSCESCHGAAAGYVEVHQKAAQRAAALAGGLADLRGKPEAIARTCVSCHVTRDADLRAAGHPQGEGFDPGRSLPKLEHWVWDVRRTAIDYAEVSRIGRGLVTQAVARAGGPTLPLPSAPGPAAAYGAPGPAARAFDPDAAEPLPDDYREPSRVGSPPAATGIATAVPESPLPSPPPATRRRPLPSPAAELVRLRLELLERLRRGGPGAGPWPPPTPREYRGPDGELLHLQDEVLALVRQALLEGADRGR